MLSRSCRTCRRRGSRAGRSVPWWKGSARMPRWLSSATTKAALLPSRLCHSIICWCCTTSRRWRKGRIRYRDDPPAGGRTAHLPLSQPYAITLPNSPECSCMRAFVAFVLLALSALSPASAQTWPQRPVTFIVSQSAGASPDVMARMIATKLAAPLGQQVIVENKPGAGNVIGAQAAARAAPDGYTFFFATSAALVTNPYMVKNLAYDPVKDFAPVALVTRSHQVIVVHPDVAAKTLPELIALDKKEPGKISMSVDGQRNLAGVTAQALNKRAGTQF